MVGSPPLSPVGFVHFFQPRKGTHVIRLLSVALALTLCYIIFILRTQESGWKTPLSYHTQKVESAKSSISDGFLAYETVKLEDSSIATSTASSPSAVHTSSVADSQLDSAAKPQSKTDTTNASQAEQFAEKKAEQAQKEADAAAKAKEQAKVQSGHPRPVYYNVHDGEQFDIEKGMKEILALIPDEIYTRDLLRPITGGGEERLREVGLRARLFKQYFSAWEALHVVSDGSDGGALVRDDVVKYLRDATDLSAISTLPRAEIIRTYEQYRSFLAQFASILFPWTAPYFSDHMTLHAHTYNAGRGIVLTGFDAVAPYMVTAIMSFRKLGCNLPVEVFYLGDNDLGDESRELLEALPGVTTRNLKQMVADQGWNLEGFASKAFSILMSSFREVLFLDADALFFRSPEVLFDEPDYVNSGALFFRDRLVNPTSKKKFLRQILPKPISQKARTSYYWTGDSSEMQESGAMVIDKWRHFVSLLVITRLNGPDRSDNGDDKGVYSFFYGDKETFWLGFELTGDTDYNFHQGNDGAIGTVRDVTRFTGQEPPVELHGSFHQNLPSDPDTEVKSSSEDRTVDSDASRGGALPGHDESAINNLTTTGGSEREAQDEQRQSIDEYGNPYGDAATYAAQLEQDQNAETPKSSEESLREAIQGMIDDGRTGIKELDDTVQTKDSQLVRREWYEDHPSETISADGLTFDELNAMGAGANFTICSPQLLHLDLEGRPLWFNGWIQEDKFDHDPKVPVSKFEYYLSERRQVPQERSQKDADGDMIEMAVGHAADWQIGDHNKCCLISDRVHKLTQDELDVLDMIVDIARENGALT